MPAIDKDALGECQSVTITCISEIGWHDTNQMLADIRAGNGPDASQWDKSWHADNAAGSASLVEVSLLDGERHKFLMDCGWNEAYMGRRFEETGVTHMLENGEIDFLFLSHEHLDHLWGLQAVLRHRPDITVCVPATFSDEALAFIRGERPSPTRADALPTVRHVGRIMTQCHQVSRFAISGRCLSNRVTPCAALVLRAWFVGHVIAVETWPFSTRVYPLLSGWLNRTCDRFDQSA